MWTLDRYPDWVGRLIKSQNTFSNHPIDLIAGFINVFSLHRLYWSLDQQKEKKKKNTENVTASSVFVVFMPEPGH